MLLVMNLSIKKIININLIDNNFINILILIIFIVVIDEK